MQDIQQALYEPKFWKAFLFLMFKYRAPGYSEPV